MQLFIFKMQLSFLAFFFVIKSVIISVIKGLKTLTRVYQRNYVIITINYLFLILLVILNYIITNDLKPFVITDFFAVIRICNQLFFITHITSCCQLTLALV